MINERIKKLRNLMNSKGIAAYIIPTFDPHQSEYIADYYKTREWISAFTGSAGVALVTKDKALLWADGRYFIQAEKQIADSEFELMKMGIPGYPTYQEWLRDNLNEGDIIGFDGKTYSQSGVENLEKVLERKNIKLENKYDFITEIWDNRPAMPMSEVFVHDVKYAGLTASEKIEQVRDMLKEKDATHTLIGSLDDIAWLYNIRGNDINNSPVNLAYASVSLDEAYVFINPKKINNEVRKHFEDNNIILKDYDETDKYVETLENTTVYLDKSMINSWLFSSISPSVEIINGLNLTTTLKGMKNPVEIKNQKNAYVKDCVALVNFMYWLDENVGKMEITEVSAADKLYEFRKEQELFVDASFTTIAGYKENAAMMHYSAEEGVSNYKLEKERMLLVDSGGNYLDGTTDITRTIVLGDISQEEKDDFTLTLKGHINLISARFLQGTTGSQLDVLARYPLWQQGLDYKCGTGHGVGFFLNVHEGPHSISPRPNFVALEKGMIVTVEPGVYKDGKHGIRIENDAVVAEDIKTEFGGQFYKFEMLSYCPIDLEAVNKELLLDSEIEWLNDYHKKTYETLAPHLGEAQREWLKEETRAI